MSAAQHNQKMQLYAGLRAKGKPSKLAHCAVARKLLDLTWAVVTKGRPFDPSYGEHVSEGPM